MAPPGRQKSEREFCLFGGVFCARRAAPCAGLAVLALPAAVAAACVPDISAGAPLPCSRPARRFSAAFTQTFAPVCLACAAAARHALCAPVPSCFGCLFACSVLVARAFFSYLLSFAFSCLALTSQTSFHLSLKPRREFPCLSPPAALFPACGPLISFCPTRAAGTCPPCALCAQFPSCFGCLFACSTCLHAHFSLIFRLFLFGCCLSNFFSFVAQAATGISLLVPSRGFVPGLRVLSPAAFSRTFVPIACCLPCALFWLFVHLSVLFAWVFSLVFHLFLPNFFLSKLLSFVAQAATGDFLACPLPWLCSRPAGLVTCCFFADFLRPLPVCLPCALFWLFVHLSVLFAWVFSLVFHLFLPNFFLSNFFSFVAQAATGLYFLRKESRQRFARGAAPSNPIPVPCGRSPLSPRCWPA